MISIICIYDIDYDDIMKRWEAVVIVIFTVNIDIFLPFCRNSYNSKKKLKVISYK